MNTKGYILTLLGAVLWLAAACGGGSAVAPDPGGSVDDATGAIEGYLTDGGADGHSVSAIGDAIAGAEVWCEDALSGEILGQDTTDGGGYYLIEELPLMHQLRLRFRYRADGGSGDVEGEAGIMLQSRQRTEFNARIRQLDVDGDGESDAADCENARLQLQIRDRLAEGGELPDVPEMEQTREQVMERLRESRPEVLPLPPLPLDDDAEEDREASELSGDYMVRGLDYLEMFNGEEVEGGLHLDGGEAGLAWGMYQIGGLDGLDIESLSVECTLNAEGDHYFLAVSNYTRMHWEWSEPISEAEYTFGVHPRSRHVSPAGNVYFLVVVFRDHGCIMHAGQANPKDIDESLPPRAAINLHASKGVSEREGVALVWRSGNPRLEEEREEFIVMRADCDCRNDTDERPQFEPIGRTMEHKYFDETAREGVVYLYGVIAVVGEERSARSNVDRGFWTSERPDEELYAIEGFVTTENDEPLAGVSIEVVYGERIWRVVSHRDGTFVIRGLPAGVYSLTPYRRGLRFEPDTLRVELPPADDTRVHFVGYRADSM